MASLVPGTSKPGRIPRRVTFTLRGERKRRTIYLGRMGHGRADKIRQAIADLVECKAYDEHPKNSVLEWIDSLPEKLTEDLARHGLIERRDSTLGQFVDQYFKRGDVEDSTKTVWRQGAGDLFNHFGRDCLPHKVTKKAAIEYKEWLCVQTKDNGEPRAPATTAKRLRFAKEIFATMAEREMIRRNPFVGVSTPSSVDETRNVFVERDTIYRVMDHAPDAEFRAMLALSRFAGLRCPSETHSLEWRRIDWHRGTILVISPKTKRNPGGGSREVPLYDALVPWLRDAFEQADDGAVFVMSKYRSKTAGSDGYRGTNMGRPLKNTIDRAGLDSWPKPWHALRASFETELFETVPIQTAAKLLGHSVKVALENYARRLPGHIEKARSLGTDARAHQKAHHQSKLDPAHSAAHGCTEGSGNENSREKDTVQVSATMCNESSGRYWI